MIYIIGIISFSYFLLIASFIIGFDKIKNVSNKDLSPKNNFSILVPFRNEADNLSNLLQSILNIKYPKNKFEIILINDDSSDDSELIVFNFIKQHPLIDSTLINNERNSNSPKKDAINTAIKIAKFEWIVTTDADCKVPTLWLQLFNQTIEKNKCLFIAAPVKFKNGKGLLYHFQNLNFLSLIGSTLGSFGINKPIMCNGANLCYNKEMFIKLNGFKGNEMVASGDDVFLMERILQTYPKKISYLKSLDATVETLSEQKEQLFYNQQLRWAAKTTAYKNQFSKIVGLVVFFNNLLLIFLGILAIFYPIYGCFFLTLFLLKLVLDSILILKTSFFLKSTESLIYYPLISVFHPFFIILIALMSLFKTTYKWKERRFEK
ncbi:glycosyltransferase [Lutibacter aestuarii]|uniref:Glycosyltransferase n=1 Tax=Lutibacter aestuarii TaxID=861111 RepID=A0ABW2Z5Y8_9FLAO|nr:glycosyltransferase [uncultured Lutibacter sp.]